MFSVFIIFLQTQRSPSRDITLTSHVEMAPNSVRSVDIFVNNTDLVKATAGAATLAELISTIPQTWRAAAAQRLTAVYRVSTKLCTVQNTIAQYERHAAEKSFPPSIVNSAKDPKIQFSKEFLGTENGRLAKTTISATLLDTRKSMLQCATTLKREELAALQTQVAFDESDWQTMLFEVAERVSASYGVSVRRNNVGGFDWTGAPAHSVAELKLLWAHGNALHYRAAALARAIADRSLLEKTRNLSLKKDADQEMRDADQELTTREVVREEMRAEMLALKQQIAGMMGNSKKSAPKGKPGKGKPKGGSNNVRQNGISKKGGRGAKKGKR